MIATAAVIVLGTVGAAACDTNDGRAMQDPDAYQRYKLENTTTTTSTVVESIPDLLSPTMPPPVETPPPTPDDTIESSDNTIDTLDQFTNGMVDLTDEGLELTGPWADGDAIGTEFTCDGDDQAPLITWTAPPEGTSELAFAVTDDDADGFVHWLVIGLPAEAGSLGGDAAVLDGAEADNDFGDVGWGGPCPPAGDDVHHYRFVLYALDQQLEQPADTPAANLLSAVQAASFGSATIMGTYERA